MAGFLSVLGPLGTALGLTEPLEKAGAIGLQNYQNTQQLAANQKGFGDMLNSLGPEYDVFKQWFNQAGPGSAHDVAAAMGGKLGEIFHQETVSKGMSTFLDEHPDATPEEILRHVGETGDWKPFTELEAAKAKATAVAAGKPAPLTTDQMADALVTAGNDPALQQDSPDYAKHLLDLGLNHRNDPAAITSGYKGMQTAIPQQLKTMEPKVQNLPDEYDPKSGFFFKRRQILDPRTFNPIRTERTGVDFTPQDRTRISQADDALRWIPEAEARAKYLQDWFDKQGWDATKERNWIYNQFKAYTANRDAAKLTWDNPLGWTFRSYGNVNDAANRYFTIMGQLKQQLGQPMGIFRAMRIFQDISTHIPDPADVPAKNLEALGQAQARFGYELQRLQAAQDDINAIPGFGGGGSSATAPSGGGGGGGRMTDKDADAAIDSLIK